MGWISKNFNLLQFKIWYGGKMDKKGLMTKSLMTSAIGTDITQLLTASLNAVDPKKAVHQVLRRTQNLIQIDGQTYNLNNYNQVFIIGFGKASVPMGEATAHILGEDLTQGVLISKGLSDINIPRIEILQSSHPVPDIRSIECAQKITTILSNSGNNDLIFFLISGGGSSLLTLPVNGVSLGDIQSLTESLLACGATINEINCIRKHLSQVKGGQLARLAAPSKIVTLILSDVIGDPLDVIASGPTAPDPTTYKDALMILKKYHDQIDTPSSIQNHLNSGSRQEIEETPKKSDPIFKNVYHKILGNNLIAAKAAIKQAKMLGFNTLMLTTFLQGEARTAGKLIASIAKQVSATNEPISRPACIIAGGETTVTIRGSGYGGRNQELALGAVEDLAGLETTVLISLATDGDDGPTDAAGAVVTGETLERGLKLGLDPVEYLSRNASYDYFNPLEDLLKIGYTGTNVNDLIYLIIY
jgi:glycerate 2-kinase